MIAGQQPAFDISFLKKAYEDNGLPWNLPYRTIDQHTLCYAHAIKAKQKIRQYNSDTIMEYVGLPPEPKPHQAINGVIWEAEAINRLLHGTNLLTVFAQYEIPKHIK